MSPLLRIQRLSQMILFRNISSGPTSNYVFWLVSGDIYRNLAFEATLLNNKARYEIESSSQRRPADVIMWRSDPCVVIGRNQVPWLEANPREVECRGWRLARRMSGGGAVFHDHGNLNISFLESRKYFDRLEYMKFLQQTLMSNWPRLNVFLGIRHDLWLLPSDLSEDTGDSKPEIDTKASRSIPSPVTNLRISEDDLKAALFEACGKRLKTGVTIAEVITINPGEEVNWVNPKEFETNLAKFQSWDWIYGASPKFAIPLEMDDGALLRLECEKGRVARLEQIGGLFPPVPLLQRISSTIAGKSVTCSQLDKLNGVLSGKPLTFDAIFKAVLEFEMSFTYNVDGSTDPFNGHSQVIDRLRALATCFQ